MTLESPKGLNYRIRGIEALNERLHQTGYKITDYCRTIGGFPLNVPGLDSGEPLKPEVRADLLKERFPDLDSLRQFTQKLNPGIEVVQVTGEQCEDCETGRMVYMLVPHSRGDQVKHAFTYCLDCTRTTQLDIM